MKTYALVISGLMLQVMCGAVGAAEAVTKAPPAATAPATPETVGALGSVSRLEFEGNVTFSTDYLRYGLKSHGDWLLAAHPAAPLADYVKVTQAALLRGYQHGGFPLAQVKETRWLENPRRLLCVISEGPRYTAGEVTVSGAGTVSAAMIVERLTTPTPEKRKPDGSKESSAKKAMWAKGKPAKLDYARTSELGEAVLKILEKEGLMQAKVKARVVRDDAARTAALEVKILAEGPRAVLDDIKVTGLKRDTQTALLKYLGLSRGLPFLSGQVQEIEKLLQESARYTSFKVKATPHKEDKPEMDLKLELVEMPEAPKLGEPLPPPQVTLVKATKWANETLNSGREDLVMTVSYMAKKGARADLEVVYNALQGLHMKLTMADDVTGAKNVRRYTVHYARNEMQALLWTHEGRTRQWLSGPTMSHYMGRLFVNVYTNAPENGKTTGALNFGAGLNPKPKETGAKLLDFELSMTPTAALLKDVREKEAWQHRDGLLILESPMAPGGSASFFTIEEATGRVREIGGQEGSNGKDDSARYRLKTEAGAWERVTRELEAEAAGLPNSYEKGEPLASWAGFLAACYLHGDFSSGKGEAARTPEETERRIAVVRDVVRKMSASTPAIYKLFAPREGDAFDVPDDPDKPKVKELKSSEVAQVGLTLVDLVVEEGSWPWLLAREVFYSTSGRNDYTGRILTQVREDPQLGPVGSWLASVLLDWTLPVEAGSFRQLALAKLSAEEFRKDWGFLVQNTSSSQRAVGQELLEKARAGENEATGMVKDFLVTMDSGAKTKVSMAPVLESFVTELRQDPERPLPVALTAAMDRVWNEQLAEKLRTMLTPKGKDGKPVDPATVAAVVGDVEITRQALADEVALRRSAFLKKPGATQAKLKAQRAEMEEAALQGLIEMELYNAAYKAVGNVLNLKFGDDTLKEIVANAFEGNQSRLEQELKKMGTTVEAYREKLAKQAVVQVMKQKIGEMATPATAEEIAQRAEALKAGAEPVREVKLRTISMMKKTVEQGEEAQQKLVNGVHARLVAGEDFGKLAKEFSSDARASDGGTRDWMPPALLSPVIGGALEKMKPGDVSEPLDMGALWILVKYEEERLQPKSAAELQREAKALLKEEKAEEFREGWLNNVRGKFKVEILPRAEKKNDEC